MTYFPVPSDDGWDKLYAACGAKPFDEEIYSELVAWIGETFKRPNVAADLDNVRTWQTRKIICIVRTWCVFLELEAPTKRYYRIVGYCVSNRIPVCLGIDTIIHPDRGTVQL